MPMVALVTCPTCGKETLAGNWCLGSAQCRAAARLMQVRENMISRVRLGLPAGGGREWSQAT